MTAASPWPEMAALLSAALHLRVAPIAITFTAAAGADPYVDASEGKPQCHIVAIAKEEQRPAASVGCSLSRARTGMGTHELTCALPGSRLEEIVTAIEAAASVDATVARYAAADAQRFAVPA